MRSLTLLAMLPVAGCALQLPQWPQPRPAPDAGPLIAVHASADDALAAATGGDARAPLRATPVMELAVTNDCPLSPAFIGLDRVVCVHDGVGRLGWVVRDDLVQGLPRGLVAPARRPNSAAASTSAVP